MKRLGSILLLLVLGYVLYYDMTIGTLPLLHTYSKTKATSATNDKQKENTSLAKYKVIEVKTGDTVLSITEEINKKKIPSIEKVVTDFKDLNPNDSPAKLQVGKKYKFPLYP
ncbi:hypothetical protein [Bacillus cereus group sp. BfR-BA-01380]|uniref:hypothetical protein n=1 Tax=Bacillus cereus group sp. BfR-BA-01380 TaxID=2920324 RepID=UPI001F581CEB|nr:hypothetical protein [Bacillus cereus group sp. BfR-BA-01380]